MQLVVFLVVWVAPMTLAQQRGVMLLAEMISAWSAVEVFLVAVVVALLEIGQVTQPHHSITKSGPLFRRQAITNRYDTRVEQNTILENLRLLNMPSSELRTATSQG